MYKSIYRQAINNLCFILFIILTINFNSLVIAQQNSINSADSRTAAPATSAATEQAPAISANPALNNPIPFELSREDELTVDEAHVISNDDRLKIAESKISLKKSIALHNMPPVVFVINTIPTLSNNQPATIDDYTNNVLSSIKIKLD